MKSLLTNQYYQIEDYFFRGISSKFLTLGDGTTAYMSGDAGLNFFYINKDPVNLEEVLRKGKCFYDNENVSFDIFIPKKLSRPEVLNILDYVNYTLQDTSVSMVFNLDKLATDKTIAVDITTEIKANSQRLDEWMIPLMGAFETTADYCEIYAAAHANALRKGFNFSHFSLYKRDKAVASITLSVYNGVSRIDDLGTTPEFQGRGYAAQLLVYVLFHSKNLGVQYCFLDASDAGYELYKKIGFVPLFENNIFSKRYDLGA